MAEDHYECAICFEPLHAAPAGVFLDAEGRRISQHLFNYAAASHWAQSSQQCPITRKAFSTVKQVPDIRTHPREWFRVVDIDGDGKLSRKEVAEVLKAQLPIDNALLDVVVEDPQNELWQRWDSDGSGFVDENELMKPGGLVQYVAQVFAAVGRPPAIPDIAVNKDTWFEFFDEDHSGSLDKEEVMRALVQTLRLGQDFERLEAVRNTVDAVWPIFDTDGSGTIEKDEFLTPNDGLADMIIATVEQM